MVLFDPYDDVLMVVECGAVDVIQAKYLLEHWYPGVGYYGLTEIRMWKCCIAFQWMRGLSKSKSVVGMCTRCMKTISSTSLNPV